MNSQTLSVTQATSPDDEPAAWQSLLQTPNLLSELDYETRDLARLPSGLSPQTATQPHFSKSVFPVCETGEGPATLTGSDEVATTQEPVVRPKQDWSPALHDTRPEPAFRHSLTSANSLAGEAKSVRAQPEATHGRTAYKILSDNQITRVNNIIGENAIYYTPSKLSKMWQLLTREHNLQVELWDQAIRFVHPNPVKPAGTILSLRKAAEKVEEGSRLRQVVEQTLKTRNLNELARNKDTRAAKEFAAKLITASKHDYEALDKRYVEYGFASKCLRRNQGTPLIDLPADLAGCRNPTVPDHLVPYLQKAGIL